MFSDTLVILTFPFYKGVSNAGTPVCDIDVGLSRMIQVI